MHNGRYMFLNGAYSLFRNVCQCRRAVEAPGVVQGRTDDYFLSFLGFFTWARLSLLTLDRRVFASLATVASNCSLMARSVSESVESSSFSPSNGPL